MFVDDAIKLAHVLLYNWNIKIALPVLHVEAERKPALRSAVQSVEFSFLRSQRDHSCSSNKAVAIWSVEVSSVCVTKSLKEAVAGPT